MHPWGDENTPTVLHMDTQEGIWLFQGACGLPKTGANAPDQRVKRRPRVGQNTGKRAQKM